MNEREKIIETLRASGYGYFITHDGANAEEALRQTADALIEAGIGDVKETEHRAEVAERALRSLAQLCAKGAKYYLQSDKAVKEREQELYDEWIAQSEKDLAEEKNEQV